MRTPDLTRARSAALLVPILVFGLTLAVATQGRITTPKEALGFNVGDDYFLASYTQLQAYWGKLAKESDRMKLVDIGKTAEGRPMVMAIITSPENLKKLDRYKEIVRKLALAEGLTDDEAHKLAAEGKAVIWIDGGLHATEVLGSQQLIEMVYQMVSRTDPETMRFLNDVILLAVPANPDGQELVANWYMREADPTKRSTAGLPRLYQKYAGHDNNRDSYMVAMPETEAMSRILYQEWFPQIMYNHHQTGPEGTVLFAPPFRDPFNYNFDPLVPIELDLVAANMHARFIGENKPGATMRTGANYSTWWNGGLRTTVYFHNMIGLLTEAIGNPTPVEIPLVLQKQLPSGDLPFPIAPQKVWHFRQSIEYSITANRSVLDIASKHREDFLYNFYRMGKNSIERGSRDSWTTHPALVAAVQAAVPKPDVAAEEGRRGPRGRQSVPAKYFDMLREPKLRDPRGYILPSDQPDFLTATKFVNTLVKTGITIQRATAAFQVNGKSYPAGSYVVKTAQSFRPHVLDMFEPQDHPNDFAYPGGPPRPPYDSAGYTLAFQMGVQFDRILDGFDGPFEKIVGFAKAPAGRVVTDGTKARPVGFLMSHQVNDGFIATNKLLAAKEQVLWLKSALTANGKTFPAGTVYVPARPTTRPVLDKLAAECGVTFEATGVKPAGEALMLRPVRIALWDRYGGSMPSGWTRWLLEQFQFPFEVVYAQTLDAGNLNAKYDVIVFVDGGIPDRDGQRSAYGEQAPANIPAEFTGWVGNVTVAKTVPQLKKFVEEGGTLITIGTSTIVAKHFGLALADAIVERSPTGGEKKLPNDKFYIPGSILQATVDSTIPLAYGMGDKVDVFFDNSPAFKLLPDAALRGTRAVAWYSGAEPLRSGWAWGQNYLDGSVAIAESILGKGRVVLFGPEVLFRGQPHGTFKLFFNGLYAGAAKPVNLATIK
ncbi:MAG TPA: M14 metallopeptidase family protein [Vicinamibacterales bacterium]|jgi:hypothetical protein